MLAEHNFELVKEINSSIWDILQDKFLAKSRSDLKTFITKQSDESKTIVDKIISCALQSKIRYSNTRFSNKMFTKDELKTIDECIAEHKPQLYNTLSTRAQCLVQLCTNIKLYRTPNDIIVKLLTKYYFIEHKGTMCNRCYAEIEQGDLCLDCITKIESCVKYRTESFVTTGTTILAFNYQFKDWSVDVKQSGEYTFNRLRESSEQYQAELPFKDYENLLVLIG